jgi:TRAP-type C4-dicarboxylate transport system permease small subunit
MLRLIHRLERILTGIESAIAVAGLAGMTALVLMQVIARNFFDTGYPFADVLLRYLVLLVSFSGAILATTANRHIRIDIAVAWLPPGWGVRCTYGAYIIAAAVCAAYTWAASRFWWSQWEFAQPNDKWAAGMGAIIPIGFALLTLHFLLRLVSSPATPADVSDHR